MPEVIPDALKKFGDNVRTRRAARDLTQEKLSELAELDRLNAAWPATASK